YATRNTQLATQLADRAGAGGRSGGAPRSVGAAAGAGTARGAAARYRRESLWASVAGLRGTGRGGGPAPGGRPRSARPAGGARKLSGGQSGAHHGGRGVRGGRGA